MGQSYYANIVLAEAVAEDHLGYRTARELLWRRLLRISEGDRRARDELVRDPQKLLHLWLDVAEQRRQHGAEPLSARREKQVLHRRIDRRPTRDPGPVEASARPREVVEHRAHDDVDGNVGEVLGEVRPGREHR
jgi:hypothetical protein